MLRRWIIRSLALALLTLCVTAWVGSYFVGVEVSYVGKTHYWSASLGSGEWLLYDEASSAPTAHRGWHMRYGEYDAMRRAARRKTYETTPYHLLGFAWHPRMPPMFQQFEMIPLWFPTTLSAIFLYLLWRKTRSQPTAKGFPIEPPANPTHL